MQTGAASAALCWYDENARDLPWRVSPAESKAGKRADPYQVWLSEIMLQQTTVATVKRRYADFLTRWSTVEALAGAQLEDVLGTWAGLGYYARARNLHQCAVVVTQECGGVFPQREEELLKLPGIGAYTAAAIAAIAFDERAVVVDGNIERIAARIFAIDAPLRAAKSVLRETLEPLWPQTRSGDFAQALMDLGAMVCTPRSPACLVCPLAGVCEARRLGTPEAYPTKKVKMAKPTRRGAAFVLTRTDGAVLLRRRPPKGLLGGMLEVASTPWEEASPKKPLTFAPTDAKWKRAPKAVRHTFTHFHLELDVWTAEIAAREAKKLEGFWTSDPATAGLPTVMRKVIEAASAE